MPLPHNDSPDLFPSWLVWLLTGLVGALMGASFGIIAGVIEPDELSRHWPILIGLAVVGFGPAAFARKAIVFFHRQAAERGYRALSVGQRWAFLAGALTFDLSVLVTDVLLEREGLLKLGRLSSGIASLDGKTSSGTDAAQVWYIVPLVITLGYVAYSAFEGYICGRRGIILNQLLALQAAEWRQETVRHLARPEVQAAAAAVVAVKTALRAIADQTQRIEALKQPFEARIAALETGRLPILDELTPIQCARIQDALDNLLGADLRFLGELRFELELIEPTSFLQSRWRWPWQQRRIKSQRAR